MAPDVDVITVPYDSGLRGARMGRGPEHLLARGLVRELERVGATVRVVPATLRADGLPTEVRIAFELQRVVAQHVASARGRGAFPLVLSGNCNTAVGTVAGITSASSATPAVCWMDAHADFNTPDTSITGFLDGMAVSMVTGGCWRAMTAMVPGFVPVRESHVVLVGTRDVDAAEAQLLNQASIVIIGAPNIASSLDAALARVQSSARELYLHLDLDALDTSIGRANCFAVPGGLTREDVYHVLSSATKRFRIAAAAITAYDPEADGDEAISRAAIDIAARLIGSVDSTR